MTRDRDSLHVEAATDADAAVALVLCAMAGGVRDSYPTTNVTAHDIDGPWTWTEATYPEPERVSLRTAIAWWYVAAALTAAGWLALALQVFAQ